MLVTHDPVDAMALADRVVVVEDGGVVQTGTPAEVSRHPRTDYVARLVGLSLLPGTGEGRTVRLDGGGVGRGRRRGERARCSPPSGPSRWRSTWPGPTAARATSGRPGWPAPPRTARRVRCELEGEVPLIADVTATAFAELGLAPGALGVGGGQGLRGRRLRAVTGPSGHFGPWEGGR